MALLHMDSFEHYGLDEAELVRGIYAEASGASLFFGLDDTRSRTGDVSLRFSRGATLRYVLPASVSTAGAGCVLWFDSLPPVNNLAQIFSFRDSGNQEQVGIRVMTTGAIVAWRGDEFVTPLGSSSPVITTGAWQHIEARVKAHDTAGEVEVRVNGVTVLSLTGIDTNSGSAVAQEIAQVAQLCAVAISTTEWWTDDLYVWNTLGPNNNDFIGDRRVLTSFPDQDTVIADWGLSAGVNGFALVDDNPADDDATHLFSPVYVAPGDQSAFEFEDLPEEVAAIAAVMVVNRGLKTDAGPCTTQVSMIADTSEALGTSQALTSVYTDRTNVFETNPDTGAPWTRAEANRALVAIRRTL
jgi:hypothetical protein